VPSSRVVIVKYCRVPTISNGYIGEVLFITPAPVESTIISSMENENWRGSQEIFAHHSTAGNYQRLHRKISERAVKKIGYHKLTSQLEVCSLQPGSLF
jgi:hypothetical protein